MMGTRSSSSAGGGGSSGDSPRGSRNNSGSRGLQDDDDEENVDLSQVLAYLLRRGQVRLVQGGGPASLHLVQSLSDSDDDNDSAWEGCLGDRYNPPVDAMPDTAVLDHSQIRTQVLLATGRLGARREQNITRQLLERQRGGCGFSHGVRCRMTSHFLPNHVSATDSYSQKAFCGVYASDGSIFMSACQDQNIRLYDCRYGSFEKFRTIKARDVGWSVLDVAFAPDGGHFLYSSWSDYIHICSIYGDTESHTALDLSPSERRFAVFSLTVSRDGREVLGGANDGCVYVYDLEQNCRILKIGAHEDDVNAVSFADDSCHILYSGGDDALCKVWDRRTMREDDAKPVGLLAGHQDGITFIDSKGDARYLLSNSKDQSIKLWDIRRFSGPEGLEASRRAITQQNWDYRWQQVPKKALRKKRLPGDTSVMTYRGHGVLHTLIRCRFSPENSTGQQYVYSGCSTGRVVIYDLLTGKIVVKLANHKACVRDVSWHPCDNRLVSSSWDGTVRVWDHRQSEFYEEDLRTPPLESEGSPVSSSSSW
ncbi:DDB1- and CUL4-associated factor 11 isoform X1 [Phyllobates terribilis]|uniref:DDB1- and CUL4-associated factor 11 isoform X1 n=2 Tax=Phyllobates terribilis TaxID=111132 RepID=UPI003CCAAAFF